MSNSPLFRSPVISGLLVGFILFSGSAHADQARVVDVGGISVTIATDSDFAFLDESNLDAVRVAAPIAPQNELLAAFVEGTELEAVKEGGIVGTNRYGLVETMPKFASRPISPEDFQKHLIPRLIGIHPRLPKAANKTEELIKEKMGVELGVDAMVIGEFDSGSNFASVLMLMKFKSESGERQKIGSMSVLTLKSRLVFIYIYTDYRDEWDITWIRAKTFSTVEATRAAN